MPATVQGLDRFAPPPAADAKRMLEAVGGRWWNVYVGGPSSKATGWTPAVVREYARHGIDRFMVTYAGQGARGTLTPGQGVEDARQALALAREFGWGGDVPLCLDVELVTFQRNPRTTPGYVKAWCAEVRRGGARPGVYANPAPLQAFSEAKVKADFVWVASWVAGPGKARPSPRDAHAATGMPPKLWRKDGQRAWQYAGEHQLLGHNVDLNVAHLGCLAGPPSGAQAAKAAPAARKRRPPLRQGDRGPVVVRMTRRLSLVRSSRTKLPYLDGARRQFDAEAAAALRAFQADHRGLTPNGLYGRRSAEALLRAARRERARQVPAGRPAAGGGKAAPAVRPSRLPELVRTYRRLETEADKAWEAIEAYGTRRGRLLERVAGQAAHHAAADGGGGDGTADVLRRIEHQLELLVAMERRELALEERWGTAGPPVGPAGDGADVAGAAHDGGATMAGGATHDGGAAMAGGATHDGGTAAAAAAANGGGGAAAPQLDGSTATAAPPAPGPAPAAAPPAAAAPVAVAAAATATAAAAWPAALSDRELDAAIDRLDRRLHRARRERLARIVRAERRLRPHVRRPAPVRAETPKPPRAAPGEPRTFVVVTPMMRHPTVERFQRLLNARLEAWKVAKRIEVDGEYGPETDRAAHLVCHALGIDPAGYKRGVTPETRIKVRHPSRRSPEEQRRGVRRRPWLRALRKRLAADGEGPRAAIAYGRRHVGVHEVPAGSNRGHLIDRWNLAASVPPGPKAYWCGSFVNACLRSAGMPNQPWLRYVPWIRERAQAGADGWSWHTSGARPGDLVVYEEGGVPGHVELVVSAEPLRVVGGNTSAGSAGSQSNGGCVAEKVRDPAGPPRVLGYARPPWRR